jgi:hypothetical protein
MYMTVSVYVCCSVMHCVAHISIRAAGKYAQMQCVAVCCSVLQCVAVCCSVLQCVAVRCSVLQCVTVYCSVLQCVAVCCSVLQCVAVCCSVLQCVTLCCSVLQCVAVCCRVLQCVFRMFSECFQCVAVGRSLSCALFASCYLAHARSHTLSHSVLLIPQPRCAVCCSVLQRVAVCSTVL